MHPAQFHELGYLGAIADTRLLKLTATRLTLHLHQLLHGHHVVIQIRHDNH
jgi:hypothetical protein